MYAIRSYYDQSLNHLPRTRKTIAKDNAKKTNAHIGVGTTVRKELSILKKSLDCCPIWETVSVKLPMSKPVSSYNFV